MAKLGRESSVMIEKVSRKNPHPYPSPINGRGDLRIVPLSRLRERGRGEGF